ncbi:MAG: hypothetical protein IK015_12330 [Treponema sp.]|nr:hypothetical protein [Treponema sp.]
MKKLIGALALAAMVAASAFAEVSFGAWVCNLPTLIASDGDGIKGGAVANPWGWGARPARADINFTSDDGKAGIVMGVYTNFTGGVAGSSDNTLMWIKPVEQIKLSLGQHDNFFGTRGDLCFGSWNWLRPNPTGGDLVRWGEGITFTSGNKKNASSGLGIQITPIEALKVFAFVPLTATASGGENAVKTLDKVFGKGVYGAMYTIDGIGKIKAQFLADSDEDAGKKTLGTFEAAFDLTAVDKLFATVGVEFNIKDSDLYGKGAKMFGVAAGASYGITEAFKVAADFCISIPKDGDMGLAFGVGLDYAINDALGLTADVRMIMPNNNIDPSLSFLVGANYACGSNASLGLGFQAVVAMGDKASTGDLKLVQAATVDGETKKFIFAVPLRFNVWF